MSTRGFLGFVAGGQTKVTYNHFDSYPSGLGVDVLGWLRSLVGEGNVGDAREAVKALRVVGADEPLTPEDIERYAPWTHVRNARPGREQPEDWYDVLHRTHGDPAAILAAGALEDGTEWATSGHPEYGYVVDFDAERFNVWRGAMEEPPSVSWPLDALPSEDVLVLRVDMPDREEFADLLGIDSSRLGTDEEYGEALARFIEALPARAES